MTLFTIARRAALMLAIPIVLLVNHPRSSGNAIHQRYGAGASSQRTGI
jgi:hypothetical protein